jgi:G protein beta subunit-like protein
MPITTTMGDRENEDDGKLDVVLATAGHDHSIRLWRVAPPATCWQVLQHNQGQVNVLAIAPDRSTLAAGGNPHIRLYNLRCLNGQRSMTANVMSTTSSGGSISAGGGQPALLFTIDPPSTEGDNKAEEEVRRSVIALAYVNVGTLLGVTDHGDVRMWAWTSQDLDPASSASSPASNIIAGPVFRGPTMRASLPPGVATSHANWLSAAFVHGPTGRVLYASSTVFPSVVRVYDAVGARLLQETNLALAVDHNWPSGDYVTSLTLELENAGMTIYAGTSRGNLFVVHSDGTLHVHYGHHASYITKLAVSPDQRWLLSTSADTTAKLHSLPSLTENGTASNIIVSLRGHDRWVWDAAWSADSKYCLTASSDLTAKLWDVHQAVNGSEKEEVITVGEWVAAYGGQHHSKGLTCVALNDYPL